MPGILFCLYLFSGSLKHLMVASSLYRHPMVSMTYAKTFVNSGELVWFPDTNKFQGYSNLLIHFFVFIHLLKLSSSINILLVSIVNLFILIAIS